MSEATVVLVHGGWGGPWCWRPLISILERHGVSAVAPQLPSSLPESPGDVDLCDDAETVADAVASIEGTIILVGHSYGGAVVAEVAPRLTSAERLVFVAALVPLTGQSATDATREVRVRTKLDEAITVDGAYLRLDQRLAGDALYNNCAAETAAWAIQQLSTQTIASFRSPRTSPEFIQPSTYISCSTDQALDPALQVVMARRCTASISLESDHSPMISNPEALFHAILNA